MNPAELLALAVERAESAIESGDTEAFASAMAEIEVAKSAIAQREQLDAAKGDLARAAYQPTEPRNLSKASESFIDHAMSIARNELAVMRAGEDVLGNFYLPETVWGDIKQFVDRRTPLVNSVNRQTLVAEGDAFSRVYDLSDINTGASTVPELGTIPSSTYDDDAVLVPVKKVAGRKQVSVEAIDRRSQTMANLQDNLSLQLARRKESTVATALVASATNVNTLSLTADGEAIVTALSTASNELLSVSGGEPTTIYLAPDRATYLTSLFADDGRPFFPMVGPSNALGTQSGIFGTPSIPGANVVVSPFLPTNFVAVADPLHLEWYEGSNGYLSADNPVNGSRQWSVYQYIAHCFWSQGVIKLAP